MRTLFSQRTDLLRQSIRFSSPLLALVLLAGCTAGATGALEWTESTYRTSQDVAEAYRVSTQAIANIGTITNSNETARSVRGNCTEKTEATVTVSERDGTTSVLVKARWKEEYRSSIGWDTGEKDTCIEELLSEMESLGLNMEKVQVSGESSG